MVYDEWAERLQYQISNYPGPGYVCTFNIKWLPGMAGDFRDIRFLDGLDSKLPYWIESKTDFSTATVQVKLGNSSTVFLHYGNGSAVSESRGDDVFIVFEDFDALNTQKWTQSISADAGVNLSNSEAEFYSLSPETRYARWTYNTPVVSTGVKIKFSYRAKYVTSGEGCIYAGVTLGSRYPTGAKIYTWASINNLVFSDSTLFNYAYGSISTTYSSYVAIEQIHTGTQAILKVNGNTVKTVNFNAPATSTLTVSSYGQDPNVKGYLYIKIPNLTIQKYTATEPVPVLINGRSGFDGRKYYSFLILHTRTEESSHSVGIIEASATRTLETHRGMSDDITGPSLKGERILALYRESPDNVPNVEEKSLRSVEASRQAYNLLNKPETSAERHLAIERNVSCSATVSEVLASIEATFHRESGHSVHSAEQLSSCKQDAAREARHIVKIGEVGSDRALASAREVQSDIKIGEVGSDRILASVREVQNGVNKIETDVNRILESTREAQHNIRRVVIEAMAGANLIASALMSVVKLDGLAERTLAYERESGHLISASVSAEANKYLVREASVYTRLDLLTAASFGKTAEADMSVAQAKLIIEYSRAFSREASNSVTVSKLSAERTLVSARVAGLQVNPPGLLGEAVMYEESSHGAIRKSLYKSAIYSDFESYREYYIQNYPGAGYLCTFTVQWLPGMAGDFKDIRFTDGSDFALPYFIDSKTDFSTATVHVRLGSDRVVVMYYGNGAAKSESSGERTYDFYDNFDKLDSSKWTTVSGSPSVSNSILTMTSTASVQAAIRSVASITWRNVIVESSLKFDSSYRANPGSSYTRSFLFDSGTTWYIFNDSTETSISSTSATAPTTGVYGTAKVVYTTSSITGYWNGVQKITTTNTDQTAQKINLRHWSAGTAQWDWIRVRKYVATEPTAVFRSSGSNVRYIPIDVTGHIYLRTSSMSIPSPSMLGDHALVFARPASISIPAPCTTGTRIARLVRESLDSVLPVLKAEYLAALERDVLAQIGPVYLEASRLLSLEDRVAGMDTFPLEVACDPISGLIRESGVYIPLFSLDGSRIIGSTRLSSCEVPALQEGIETLSVLYRPVNIHTPPIVSTEARLLVCQRESGFGVRSAELIVSQGKGQVRDALFSVSVASLLSDWQFGMNRNAECCTVIESFADRVLGSIRTVDVEVPNVKLLFGHLGTNWVTTDHSVNAPEMMGSCSVSLVRTAGVSMSVYMLAGDLLRPTCPFEVLLEKLPFYADIEKTVYDTIVTKPAYYAELWSETNMHEITLGDTDSFFGTLYDTDPSTDTKRLMPLSGKTVKAILKGGVPDCTIEKDCTITGDGQVRFDLSSTDIDVPGLYTVKFLVTGTNFRKELPEKRDEVETIRVNDATSQI